MIKPSFLKRILIEIDWAGEVFFKHRKAISVFYCLIIAIILGYYLMTGAKEVLDQHFVYLAKSFTEGKLYFTETYSPMGWDDTSLFNGRYYWPLGIFPALILTPFVLIFGTIPLQGYISFPLNVLNFFLLYKISRRITERKFVSLLLPLAYIFGSAYIKVIITSVSWYFAHVVASTFLFLSIYLTLVKPRPVLAGMFFSFAFLTRISIFLGIIFFLSYYYFLEKKVFINRTSRFMMPVVCGVLLFFLYNYARFGNVFESGYRYQILKPPGLEVNREVGMWSIKHIPTNLYIFLLKGPDVVLMGESKVVQKIMPSPWGMSFLLTSPVFLLVLFADMKKKLNRISLISASAIALFLFGSFGLGSYQYGYRFALDFQPFLFLVLADVFRKKEVSINIVLLIFTSFIFNLYMVSVIKFPN